ncbi:alpha/beta hydrolase fold domain-containing protein [Streptomyces sp. NPDC008122]|uniref:alpha/beta hydrolase n=1 Tax=Streptomyces sp. NPDC008122 TaxID=3364810 RepID=UPI0036E5D212
MTTPPPPPVERSTAPPRWRELLDPESLRAADFLTEVLPQPLHTLGLEGVRRFTAPQPPPRLTRVASVTEEKATWTGPAEVLHSVPVRIYRPHTSRAGSDALPCLLYLHGGGFTVGSLDGVDEVCRLFSHHAECVVVSVDYRLAPEHPFPAAVDDTRAAHTWLVENAAALGIDSHRIAVGGDSAGGSLAAALCLDLHSRRLPQPALQVLVYPAVDDSFARPSWTEFADAPLMGTADAQWFRHQYVGDDGAAPSPLLTPLQAPTLAGLAPAHVITAEVDCLRDDAEAYARRLQAEGVPVRHRRYPGVFHGFFTEIGAFTKATEAVTDACASLRAVFAGETFPS